MQGEIVCNFLRAEKDTTNPFVVPIYRSYQNINWLVRGYYILNVWEAKSSESSISSYLFTYQIFTKLDYDTSAGFE